MAHIVHGCTDTLEKPKPPWKPRKVAYLAHLEDAPLEVLRVCAADKVHNARAIVADLVRDGSTVWARFSVGKKDILWYYSALAEVLGRRFPGRLSVELARTVEELEPPAIADPTA